MNVRLERHPDPADIETVQRGLHGFNHLHAPADDHAPLVVSLRDATGHVVGGLLGQTYWDWLHIDVLWIHERFRRNGYGGKLLEAAEQEARHRKCRRAHVDTLSFQSPAFYEKHGYAVFGVLEDHPEGHRRVYLWKRL